jgi:hypothetical protein
MTIDMVFDAGAAPTLLNVRAYVESLMREGLRLRKHPLGFLFSTMQVGHQRLFRLHIWHPKWRVCEAPDWRVHDHSFSFRSRVLVGRLEHIVYDVKEIPDSNHELYEVEYSASISSMVGTGKLVRCDPISRDSIVAQQEYCLEQSLFHDVLVKDDDFTSTAMFCVASSAQPRVVGPCKQGARSFERAEMSAEESEAVLITLLERL